MKRCVSMALALVLMAGILFPVQAGAAESYEPNPQTAYARTFLAACEGQAWLWNQVEHLLRSEQKSIDTLTGPGDLSNIKSLGFEGMGIAGHIPPAIGQFTQLRYLFLGGNQLTGPIPAELFGLQKLAHVDLSDNKFAGAIPPEFGTMPGLTALVLKNNAFTGNLPDSLLSNPRITILNVMDNDLTGGVPTGISGMTGLTYLNLSENKLEGNLPDVSALSALKSLSLWDCGLTGLLPDSLFTLVNLQILDLSGNQLVGEVSPSLGNLVALEYLALDGNQLRGTLPDAFGGVDLETVHLENNYFRGLMPPTLQARSAAGAQVFLGNNYMTGDALKALTNNTQNFADGATTPQYQLAANRATVQVSKTGSVNLYALLHNRALSGGGNKPMLNPEEYTITADGAKLAITTDGTGIHARALTDIPLAENCVATIQIKENTGSLYSAVKLTLTTDTVSTGGGGMGGGGTPIAPTPVTHKKYMDGFDDGKFGPDANVTREQTAKLLIDALGREVSEKKEASFKDVAAERWSFPWIESATRDNLMFGYGGQTFGPGNQITRAEMAAVLSRAAAMEGRIRQDSDKSFSDVDGDAWYANAVQQAVGYGLIHGYDDGTFRPEQYITRAETVVMVNRMLPRDYKTAPTLQKENCPFPDVAKEYWAYGDILEAVLSHQHH